MSDRPHARFASFIELSSVPGGADEMLDVWRIYLGTAHPTLSVELFADVHRVQLDLRGIRGLEATTEFFFPVSLDDLLLFAAWFGEVERAREALASLVKAWVRESDMARRRGTAAGAIIDWLLFSAAASPFDGDLALLTEDNLPVPWPQYLRKAIDPDLQPIPNREVRLRIYPSGRCLLQYAADLPFVSRRVTRDGDDAVAFALDEISLLEFSMLWEAMLAG